jgi:acyl carrier protein
MSTLQMMDEAQIKETLLAILEGVAPEADFDEIGPDEDVRDALDIDSFDFLNVLIALNEETGVEIPEADYGQLVSINDIVNYVLARMERK